MPCHTVSSWLLDRSCWLGELLLLLTVWLRFADAAQAQDKVHPRVWRDTAAGQTANFIVLLTDQADAQAAARHAPDRQSCGRRVVSVLRDTATRGQGPICAVLQAHGATNYSCYWIANLIAVEGKRPLIEALAARDDVRAIESDGIFRAPLERPAPALAAMPIVFPPAVEPGLVQIKATNLWGMGYTGENIIYANADTGVQWNHPALQPHYRGWNGTNADHNYNWWDAIHRDFSGNSFNPRGFNLVAPADDDGHGTYTLGVGVGSDGINHVGVAPGAQWIACRNMDEGVGRPSTHLECLQFFLAPTDLAGNNPDPDRRPDCVGNSYSCPPDEFCAPHSLHLALESLRAAGIFMSVAAGNNGPECETVNDPPALEASAVAVGATDLNDFIASFSSRGPVTVDGSQRRKPDLVAPGVNVRSTFPTDTYRTMSGTSASAPHVAGAVALLWSAWPHLRGRVDETQTLLQQSAVPLFASDRCGGDGLTQVPNNTFGFGRIDVLAAFQAVNRPPLASNLTLTVGGDVAHTLLLAGSDPEGASIRFEITGAPNHGRLSGFDATNGAAIYTPAHGFAGGDSFTFRVHDGLFHSSNAVVALSVIAPLDRDGDGMPDYWEIAKGLDADDPSDASVDNDLDGFENGQEYLANTDPAEGGSALRILRATRDASNNPVILWQSIGGTRYRVQYSPDTNSPLSFLDIVRPAAEEIDAAPVEASSTMTFTDDFTLTPPPVGAARYYRIKIVR